MRGILAFVSLLSASAVGSGAMAAGAAPPPLSVYGQLPGFEKAAISPSGDHIAIIGIFQEQRRLLIIDKDNNPLSVIPLGDVKIRGLAWAGDDRVMVYKSDTVGLGLGFTAEKAELFSAIVIPVDHRQKVWTVFQDQRTITGGVQGFYGVNQRGGTWYGYFGAITLDGDGKTDPYLVSTKPVLYEVDFDTRAVHKLAPRAEDGVFRRWTLAPDGKVSATLDYVSRTGSWSIRNGSGQKIAVGSSQFDGVGLVGLGTAGTSLIYERTDDDSGADHWMEVPLTGGDPKEILSDVEVQRSFFDRRSDRLIGYTAAGDVPTYHFFDAHQQKVVDATLRAFPGKIVTLIDWNDAFDRLIVRTEGGDDPQSWWLVDIKTGRADPIGQSYMVPDGEVGPVRMIRYKAGDGTPIAGVLTLPPGRAARNLPIVIFPHGGPADHDELGFDWWAQAFAARGYAVLQPNFRGSTGYGAAFQHAGNGEWGRKMQADISDGLAYLVHEGIADPKRACIMGASYGGYAALAGVTLQQGLYRCAVSVAGISDVARLAATDRDESGGDETLIRSLKQEIGSGRDLTAISPIRFVDKVTVPILLIHGKDDTRVHYEQSRDMAAALQRAGKTVDFVTLAGEDHWLSKGETRLAMLQAAVSFVEKYNPADATTGPEATAATAGAPAK